MKENAMKRALAAVMASALLVQLLPAQCFAAAVSAPVAADAADKPSDTYIVGEVAEYRTEDTKHFRLSDGTFIAVDYGMPVHFQDENDLWQDIDNSLDSGTAARTYQIRNADTATAFSPSLDNGILLTTSRADKRVSMKLLDTAQVSRMVSVGGDKNLPAETDLEIASRKTTEGAETAEADGRTSAAGITYNRAAAANVVEDVPTMLNLKDDYAWDVEDIIPDKLQSSVLYEEVFPNVDLLYTAYGYNIKEQIIVKEPTNFYRYDFLLELEGLTAALNEDGSVSLLDSDDVEAYKIPIPYMTDGDGNLSMDVTFSLTETEQGTILTVQADAEWINAEDRVFPVMIDPTISVSSGSALDDIYSVYTMEDAPNTTTLGRQQLYCGACPNSGITDGRYRIYMHFNNLPPIPKYVQVIDASLHLHSNGYEQLNYDRFPIGLFRVTDDKPSNYASYYDWFAAMTWNNQPEYETTNIIDYAMAESGAVDLSWDMTELVKTWYATGTSNRSIALAMVNEEDMDKTSGYAYTYFYAYATMYPPVLIVSYRNNTGIEPYYTYQTLGAGAAGTAYIADGTGQLKVVKELVGYASTTNPISVNLVYNSDYFSSNSTEVYSPTEALGLDMTVGYGWKLDVIQKVEEQNIGGIAYKKYTDGDGSIHYFCKNTQKDPTGTYYYDEDGLGLKIQDNGSNSYIMSDDFGNTWNFTNNFLRSIVDADNNTIYINYANGKLTTISQKNNLGTEIRIATFTYEGNVLSTVTDAAGAVYTLSYSEGRLFEIKKDNTTVARYVCMGNRVRKLTDVESGYSIDSTYGSDGRIASFYEIVGSVTGAAVTVTYPGNVKTVYRNHGADRTAENSDDILTHYMFDNAGRTVNAYTTDHFSQILGASNAVYYQNSEADKRNNRTLRTGSIGVAAQQLIRNTGFESTNSGLAWTLDGFTLSQINPRTGAKSLRSILTANNTVSAKRVTEALAEGITYCFSVYVNTSQITEFKGDGVYLKVTDTSGNSWIGDPLSYSTSDKMDGGWVRLSLTFKTQTAGNHTLSIYNHGAIGTLYVDDVQLEKGEAPSSYNLVENGGMQMGSAAWTLGSGASVVDNIGNSSTASLKIYGDPTDATTHAWQDIPVNLPGSQTFILSGWGKANAVPDDQNPDDEADTNKQYGLRAVIYYEDGQTEAHYAPFCASIDLWQFTSATIVPKRENYSGKIEKIRVVCCYEQNANIAWFDNISLVREDAQTMKYDEEGNLISVTTTGLSADTNTYDGNNNLIKTVTGGYGTYSYSYDNSYKPHQLTSVELADSKDNMLLKQTMTYDATGNTTSTTLSGTGKYTMSTSVSYSADKNLVSSITDATGATVTYSYGAALNKMWALPSSVAQPLSDTQTLYTRMEYDEFGRTTKTSIASTAQLEYHYNSGSLSSLVRTDLADNEGQTYNFTYDAFGNMTAAKVGTVTLASYTYAPGNGNLLTQTYANGDSISYTYDKLGRVKTADYSDGRTLAYAYTGDGQLYSVTTKEEDGKTTTYIYTYDALGRLVSMQEKNNDGYVLLVSNSYNENNQLSRTLYKVGGALYSQSYTYNAADGSINTVTMPDTKKLTMGYDSLRRLSTVTGGVTAKRYLYRTFADNTTTNQVTSLTYTGLNQAFQYTYDIRGNIATYAEPGKAVVTYTYDKQGQLLSAASNTNSYSYTYDNVGNILTATENGVTHNYTYSTYDWKDKLVAYDGLAIAYDASGNPTSYYNGTRWNMTWENGRELATATSGNTSLAFTYDGDGIRTSKTVNGVEHKYYYCDGKLLRETYGNNILDFSYNPDGSLYALRHKQGNAEEYYYYVTNLQGDVIAIVDESGEEVASYEYDPYGNILSDEDAPANSIAAINPMRYRGYYYDTETGFYYVSSRYYDPEIGRFISADSYASTGQGFLGCNMFAYCLNNPVCRKDISGTNSVEIFDNEFDPTDDDNEFGGGHTGGNNSYKVSYNGGKSSVYRGGNDFTVKSNEVKINPQTGNVKTSHGISLGVNPEALSKFGGAYRIETIPEGLNIIQRGGRAEHFEIVPAYEMPLVKYQGLLNHITFTGPYWEAR